MVCVCGVNKKQLLSDIEIFEGEKLFKEGDIIELEGKKYYMEYYDGHPCGFCALRGELCNKYFSSKGYDCAYHTVYAILVEDKIKEEQEKIKDSEELIKKLL